MTGQVIADIVITALVGSLTYLAIRPPRTPRRVQRLLEHRMSPACVLEFAASILAGISLYAAALNAPEWLLRLMEAIPAPGTLARRLRRRARTACQHRPRLAKQGQHHAPRGFIVITAAELPHGYAMGPDDWTPPGYRLSRFPDEDMPTVTLKAVQA